MKARTHVMRSRPHFFSVAGGKILIQLCPPKSSGFRAGSSSDHEFTNRNETNKNARQKLDVRTSH